MKRKIWIGALGLVAVLVAGGLFASNMGFKLNYALESQGTNGSNSGTQSLALPYNQQTNLVDAFDLINDINAGAGSDVVGSVSRYVISNDGLETYTGVSGSPFSLVPGESYLVKMDADYNYIVVGSHDPTLSVTLYGQGDNGSNSGTNLWSYPYHSTSATAKDLIDEINAASAGVVGSVSRYVSTNDGLETYTGVSGTPFALAPGEGYFIKVNSTVSWTPTHY
jgi:hypothetical protein